MTLEEFEKTLERRERDDEEKNLAALSEKHASREEHHRHHHRQHHHHRHDYHQDDKKHRHKRSGHSNDGHEHESKRPRKASSSENSKNPSNERAANAELMGRNSTFSALPPPETPLKRDSWMEGSSSLEYVSPRNRVVMKQETVARNVDSKFPAYDSNQYLQTHEEGVKNVVHEPACDVADYTFGDAGSQWRMTKLKAVFKQAAETHRPVDHVALERFGDLRAFDDAREEQIELDRRDTYGKGYAWREKPNGELFMARKQDTDDKESNPRSLDDGQFTEQRSPDLEKISSIQEITMSLDQTAMNRLKAQMMKSKMRGSPNASELELQFNKAIAHLNGKQEPKIVVLNAVESRLVTNGRGGEVKPISTKRGRERGLVEENEAMTIEDMLKEERRTRNEAGGDGKRYAERIAKDGKFDNDLDYLDENANKLAKRVRKSEISLKNMAISDFRKLNHILDRCPLCHREDENIPPIAPVVSLATRVYLTLPTEPEISDGAASIIPLQHRANLLECDDDEWEEIRNFMKCLTQMYHQQGRDVIFYENAIMPQGRKHASMEAVPLPQGIGDTAPAFFKEAILAADEEWTQHRKLIDTLSKANQGLGKLAFRRSLVKEMPYFHVWFHINGGLGHIVEDANKWPKGDLFAREIIGGMLDLEPHLIRKQGRWINGTDRRVEPFRQQWKNYDWTGVLHSD